MFWRQSIDILKEIIEHDLKNHEVDEDRAVTLIKGVLQKRAESSPNEALELLYDLMDTYYSMSDVVKDPYENNEYEALKELSDIIITIKHSDIDASEILEVKNICEIFDIKLSFLEAIVDSIGTALYKIKANMNIDHIDFN